MKTDIPTELVEAQRALMEAGEERQRAYEAARVAGDRYDEAQLRQLRAWSEFQQQVERQVQELAGSGEGT